MQQRKRRSFRGTINPAGCLERNRQCWPQRLASAPRFPPSPRHAGSTRPNLLHHLNTKPAHQARFVSGSEPSDQEMTPTLSGPFNCRPVQSIRSLPNADDCVSNRAFPVVRASGSRCDPPLVSGRQSDPFAPV